VERVDKVTWRSIVTRTALALGLFVALGYLAVRLVPGAGDRLSSASPGWIAICVVLEVVACAGFAACFWACFSYPPYNVSRTRSAEIALGELAAFAIVPTGLAAPLLRFWVLGRGGMPLRTIAVRSVVHAPILNAPYVAAAVVLGAGVLVGAGPGDAPVAVALAPIGVVLVAVAIAAAFTRSGRRARPRTDVQGWRRISSELGAIVPEGLREIPARARHPAAVGGAAIYWGCDCAVMWAAFHAVGASQGIGVVALAYMLGQLGTALPLPGGVGGVEPVMLGVLTASGVGAGAGAAAIVVYRAVSLGLQAALGSVAVGLLIPAVRAEARR
jgi:uncharacterized membrane protein YbhN (UPF0104 family)